MTKKHFEALAVQLRMALIATMHAERPVAIAMIIAVADACRSMNGSFDRSKFYTACGLTTDERIEAEQK